MEATLRKAKGHIWLAVAATLIVTVLPLVAVYTFQEASGVVSPWISGLLGATFSIGLALIGAALWRKFGSNDLVFSDLLIWGYLRRVWIERRLLRVSLQATSVLRDELDLSREGRAAVLADFASVIEQSDPYLHGHSRRVARHSYMIAKMMRLPKSTVETIRTAAAIHDLGK
ncbi:MAG: hypothetical protein KY429_12135, partial [Actinobacteria bacterium]|nr:hypothetical protein [Actinomycetota bacterium]